MDFSPLFQANQTSKLFENHDCETDCDLFEQCKRKYAEGTVIKCMFFGNKKNFVNATKN